MAERYSPEFEPGSVFAEVLTDAGAVAIRATHHYARGAAVVIYAGHRVASVDTLYVRPLPGPRGSILMPDPIQLNAVPDPIHRNADVEYHSPVHELRPETFVHD